MELIKDEINQKIIEVAKELSKEKSVDKITVRDILKQLNITNRVFYNRFHNIDEVFEILYKETIGKVRESLFIPYNEGDDFGQYIMNIATNTLVLSYESRESMSQFIFEADSGKNDNFDWWNKEIITLIQKGKEIGFLNSDLDNEAISYSLWCFIRGFNADALARKLPKEKAKEMFEKGFSCFLNGLQCKQDLDSPDSRRI